jgi:hypothetical protein
MMWTALAPGYAGIDTRDYYLFPDKWLEINLSC